MNTKLLKIVCLSLISCLILGGCGENEKKTDITEAVLAQFEELTKIPRPSHHEEKISNYLKKWAEDREYTVIQDEANNIIFEVPATKGCEALPKVALQCHMDMVFVQKEGLNSDPTTTEIKTVNDGTYLTSDGNTSLGADDGIGIATALCIADGKMEHGALRVIITTNEEDGLGGTKALDPKYVSDIDYLINLDSETEGEVCVSTAGDDTAFFTKEIKAAKRSKEKTYQIDIKGLAGGHSGIDIDKNRLNGGMEMGYILNSVKDAGIDFELKSLNGGEKRNAIISSASAVVCIDEKDYVKLTDVVNSCGNELKSRATDKDSAMEINISNVNIENDDVIPSNEKEVILTFLKEYKNGVRTMSADMEGLVESSSNLGIINADSTGFKIVVMSRSSNAEVEKQHMDEQKALAEALNFTFTSESSSDAWQYKPDNRLEQLVCEAYNSLYEKDIKVLAVHAGLECGTYAKYNKNLNMAAIGATITDPHTINERLEIASVEKVWKLLEKVLTNIK